MNGFAHTEYVDSLAEFGTPRKLPLCDGWILERRIPAFPYKDAMGCYPLFVCRDWSQLHSDMSALQGDHVSLSLVTDPFGHYDEDLLRQCFDLVVPFKEHFVADLSRPIEAVVSRHHRKYVRRALKNISVEISTEPINFLDEWTELYSQLAKKFNVNGVRAFSRSAFAKQLAIPGAVMFRALYQSTVVAAHLLYVQNSVCYGHLVGVNPVGQDLLASYALYWSEIEYFADKVAWLDWGAGAGIRTDNSDGLTQFKRGWSTGTRSTYFCGKILNREKYDEIINSSGAAATDYFPAYRKGEFG